ncbi:MAG: excinuclease ABC subunit UvrA, partial [Candidatus Tectomicrobia bacterium]|nr:excinuclease ABC subunit UvrA [Candidatus Tectomicrobia bacterium]
QILVRLLEDYKGEKVTLLAPAVRGRKGFHKDVLGRALQRGASEVRVDGEILTLEPLPQLDRYREHDIDVVVGSVRVGARRQQAVKGLLERALRMGQGASIALAPGHPEHLYSLKFFCPACNIGFDDLDPRLFSFNSRQGACPECRGAGARDEFDPALLIPDRSLSLRQGALVLHHGGPFSERHRTRLLREAERILGIDVSKPFGKAPARQRQGFWHGTSGRGASFEGILPHCRRLLRDNTRERVRRHLAQFMRQVTCDGCHGTRLRPQARAVRVSDRSICDIAAQSVDEAVISVPELVHGDRDLAITETLLPEIMARLQCMQEVGLGYLTLDRRSDTLSGGEAQRLRLAAQLGSNLRGVCYVLDEPTIGLHPRDNARLLGALQRLKGHGNSILVVEHDEATMRSADHLIDLGPGGGMQGGRLVAAGSPQHVARQAASVTGRYLRNGSQAGRVSARRSLKHRSRLTLRGAREHNLKGIDVSFPLETFIAVTGVSGSGKSTLVEHTLYPALRQCLGSNIEHVGAHDSLEGAEAVRRVLQVDHTPIGKSPRSNPATYVGFYDNIRRLLAQTPDARLRGYTPGRFSFNVKGGRCDACGGQGQHKVEMNFLPDVFVPCETCRGRRFTEETLEIAYNGRNAAAILDLTVTEAVETFANVSAVHRPLQIMHDAGLGYLTLGQPSNTLSGGEAQRIKLAYELNRSTRTHTVYILDEPTTGLHPADVEKLLHVLQSLVDSGNTVIVIEHNLEVIRQSDYVIDLGPEGGQGGGHVVIAGPPGDLIEHPQASHTARFLRQHIEGNSL